MTARAYSDIELYRRLALQARPYWLHIATIFLLSLLSTPMALLTPLPLKVVFDSVIGDHPLPGFLAALVPGSVAESKAAVLGMAAVLVLAIAGVTQMQALASSFLDTYTGERLVLGFRARLFHHVQRLSLVYHDVKGTRDTTYRILYDAPSIQWFAIHGIIPFVSAGFMLVGMIYVTARIDWQLAVVALAISPLLLGIMGLSRRRLRRQWTEAKELESSAVSVVQEVLGAVRVVKAFGQEDRERERFVRRANEGARAHIRVMFSEGVFGLLIGLSLAVGTAAVLFIGARHVRDGAMTLGELFLVMSYLGQLYSPLKAIAGTAATIQNSLAGAERAFAVLDEPSDVVEREHARAIGRAAGPITFRSVSFAYEAGQAVLHDISFDVPSGARVGIAGATGAGKTTLVSLLIRFYDPQEGAIFLDGVDLRDYRLSDLRNQFAIVLQEPVLFSTSIAENIAYARPSASEEEIIEAAKAANAHEFIERLPQGYQTPVGERGMRLSGGERQRISLARAFLLDAPILILDEPTSSIDTKTESGILEVMERLTAGRTVFTIAHRRNTLAACDILLEIDEGRLVRMTVGGLPASEAPPALDRDRAIARRA